VIIPEPTPRTLPFWAAAARGELLLPRCGECGVWLHPQDETCARGHLDHVWAAASGTGTIVAATVVHRTGHPALPAPYTVLVVRLDEGPQLVSSLSGPGRVAPGSRVRVVFDRVSGPEGAVASTLPRFAPFDQIR
jgi:uncharacterized OB-fold protein